MMPRLLYAAATLLFLGACGPASSDTASLGGSSAASSQQTSAADAARPDGWDAYWYAGQAELNRYSITQNRYGEDRQGEAVLVFVTEPFFADTQVKDDGQPSKDKSVSVLKLNRIHRFTTGIYDYSLMLSAFTPVSSNQYPHTLKTTLSAQDWCGHSWYQLNYRKGSYEAERRSYFQAEADANERLTADLLEDELPALVRLDPTTVPTGTMQIIPGAMFSAMFHVMPSPQTATVTMEKGMKSNTLDLVIDYSELDRKLVYQFEAAFPHKLTRWRETYKGDVLSTGVLEKSFQSPYWQHNALSDKVLRDSLGLQ